MAIKVGRVGRPSSGTYTYIIRSAPGTYGKLPVSAHFIIIQHRASKKTHYKIQQNINKVISSIDINRIGSILFSFQNYLEIYIFKNIQKIYSLFKINF